jgi:hypothetical protein
MANTYLSKTLGTPTNNKKWTFSAWCKRSAIDVASTLISSDTSTTDTISMASNGKFNYYVAAGNSGQLTTSRLFQDVSAWYHIVVAVDTTQATASNRIKIYINGVQETVFSTETYPSQNFDTKMNSAIFHTIGGYSEGSSGEFWNGSMSHINFIDGSQELPTAFGETDSTTGEWKIKTSPSVTYGNNGFFILKDGNSVTDQSGEGNNFAVTAGTLTNNKDNPSNVFCTFNALNKSLTNLSLTNGNTTLSSTASGWYGSCGTLGFQKGFATYFEAKAKTIVYALTWGLSRIGEGTNGTPIINPPENDSNYDYMIRPTTANTVYYRGADQSVTVPAISAGDILSCLVSASGVVKFYINNVLIHTYSQVLEDNRFYFPVAGANGTGQGWDFNFGNGYFGTTAVASQGTNTSGIGIFEYDVPSGTAALSTKGLNL